MIVNNIHAYTVIELRDALDSLVKKGMENHIVLVPDWDMALNGDYRTIGSIDTEDISKRCIYLEINSDEDEKQFWGEE